MRILALSRKSVFVLGAIVLCALASLYVFSAFFAKAEIGPEITITIHTGSHATTTQAAIGAIVHANALLATTTGSTTPTGTVDFRLYQNISCTGASTTQTAVPLVNGIAESATTSVPATGLSYLVRYNGDPNNVPSEGACTPLVATGPNATVATTLSTTTVLVGTFVHDTATLSNATANASGTVAYTVYTNNACTAGAQSAGTKNAANALVPDSDSIQFNTPGTYYWRAVYSGDSLNGAATSSCQSEVLTVLATSTPPGHIVVDKVTSPSGATTTFSFNAGGSSYDDFSLTDAAAPNNQVLAPGTYSVTELAKQGWNLTSSACSLNGAASTAYTPGSNLTLGSGDTITCTFTNTQATTTPPGNGDDDEDNDHDNGKHRGFILGLPFGILKKVFNDLDLPHGVLKNFGDAFDIFGGDDDDDNDEKSFDSLKAKIKDLKNRD